MTSRSERTWDKVVRFGFDKVISPAIDAIARKPMARHYFVEAWQQNQRHSQWLLDLKLMNETIPASFGKQQALINSARQWEGGFVTAVNDVRRAGRMAPVSSPAEARAWVNGLGVNTAEIQRNLNHIVRQWELTARPSAAAVAKMREKPTIIGRAPLDMLTMMDDGIDGQRLVRYLDTLEPTTTVRSIWELDYRELRTAFDGRVPLEMTRAQWSLARDAKKNIDYVDQLVGELSATRALVALCDAFPLYRELAQSK